MKVVGPILSLWGARAGWFSICAHSIHGDEAIGHLVRCLLWHSPEKIISFMGPVRLFCAIHGLGRLVFLTTATSDQCRLRIIKVQ